MNQKTIDIHSLSDASSKAEEEKSAAAEGREPDFVMCSRVMDAISWIIKAHAQLSCIESRKAREVMENLRFLVNDTENIMLMKEHSGPSRPKDEAHRLMRAHTLVNAAGHALYGQCDTSGLALYSEGIYLFREATDL